MGPDLLVKKYFGVWEGTPDEVKSAYTQEYGKNIKSQRWTKEEFIEWFPREDAGMTEDEVRQFAYSCPTTEDT